MARYKVQRYDNAEDLGAPVYVEASTHIEAGELECECKLVECPLHGNVTGNGPGIEPEDVPENIMVKVFSISPPIVEKAFGQRHPAAV